jgi:adenosylcobinamide-phosphate synthase
MWPINPSQIVVAMIFDVLIGDPRRWPHIARYAGALSQAYEQWLTDRFQRTVLLGFLFWFMVVGTMLAGYVIIHSVCLLVSPVAGYFFDVFVIYQAIATRDLQEHVKAVLQPLTAGDINAARERLSRIVGRDTETLDQSEISRATIESVAESLVDGIVAPLFWTVFGGAPGALIYRTTNTLDSIVGHRTEAYEKFGKTSARIDDLLNWLPSRICALVLCLSRSPASWTAVRREAALHASPNAGWPEAAMAYALGVRLGGGNSYDGKRVELPVFNASGRAVAIADIQTSLTRMWWVVFAAGGFFLLLTSTFLCLRSL